jgi:hypothetical protein
MHVRIRTGIEMGICVRIGIGMWRKCINIHQGGTSATGST